MVRGVQDFQVLGETPLRMDRMESAWLRNNSSTIDTLIRVCAPQGFDFRDPPGAVVMHGWFLQLYAYEDKEGNLRRAPVFIVTGEDDSLAPPARSGALLHEILPDSRLVVLPTGTHTSLFEHHEEIAVLVDDFLLEVGVTAPWGGAQRQSA